VPCAAHPARAVAWVTERFFGRLAVPTKSAALFNQGVSAELIAARSHQRAAAASDTLSREILPVKTTDCEGPPVTVVSTRQLVTAERLGLTPRGAPIAATRKILEKAKLGIDDIDAFEVNEAFASVPLAWLRELHAGPEKLNPRGRARALAWLTR